jgi:hypothetical protein
VFGPTRLSEIFGIMDFVWCSLALIKAEPSFQSHHSKAAALAWAEVEAFSLCFSNKPSPLHVSPCCLTLEDQIDIGTVTRLELSE